jgi:hypothetical protein
LEDYSPQDLRRLYTCKAHVLRIARRGLWFTNKQLLEDTGANDAPRRRRELETIDGFCFEKRKINGTNVMEFLLIEQ